MLRRLRRDEAGQVLPLVAILALALVGLGALVVDAGSWHRSQRQLQSAVDAAALAAAQDLPLAAASATADGYMQTNLDQNPIPATASSWTVSFPTTSPCSAGACVQVDATAHATGFLARAYNDAARALDFSTVAIGARATAMVRPPLLLGRVAPVAVPVAQACTPLDPSCFGASHPVTLRIPVSGITTTGSAVLDLAMHAGGLPDCKQTGTRASDLTDWITSGFGTPLPTGDWYCAANGMQTGGVKQGLGDLAPADVIFFPVFDTCTYDRKKPPKTTAGCTAGQNDGYHVVGFSAFAVTGYTWTGNTQEVAGYFVTYVASGSIASGSGGTDFGVHVVTLVG